MARGRKPQNRKDYRGEFAEEETEKVEDEETEDEEGDEDEEADEEELDAEAEIEIDDADIEEEVIPDEDDEDEEAPKPKKKARKKAVPKAAKPKRRSAKVVRLKAVWVVYDNSNKELQVFDYSQKAEAEAFCEEKNVDKKACYVQMKKVALEE